MKKLVSDSSENVLFVNSIIRTTDGRNHVVFHAESGLATKSILTLLIKNEVNFFFENYWDKMMEVDETTGKKKTIKGKKVKFSKFVLRIDELQGICPKLYLELKQKNEVSKMIWNHLVDCNLLDDYFIVG